MKYARHIMLVAALLVSSVLVLLGVKSFHDETIQIRSVVPPYDLFWCSKDDDCSVVDQIGCCSCAQGGAQAAVTKWHRDDLEDFLEGACRPAKEQVCVEIDLCRTDLVARCVGRRCRLAFEEEARAKTRPRK